MLDFKCSEVEKLEKGRVEKEKRDELKKERRRRSAPPTSWFPMQSPVATVRLISPLCIALL